MYVHRIAILHTPPEPNTRGWGGYLDLASAYRGRGRPRDRYQSGGWDLYWLLLADWHLSHPLGLVSLAFVLAGPTPPGFGQNLRSEGQLVHTKCWVLAGVF